VSLVLKMIVTKPCDARRGPQPARSAAVSVKPGDTETTANGPATFVG
jgi:hypothetical protein